MRPVCLLSPLVAAAVALGACGGSEEETTGSTTQAETSTTTPATATATPERRELETELRRLLAGGDGAVDVDCAIEHLRTTLSNEAVKAAIAAAGAGEEIPVEAVDAAYEAGQECAAR
jgi:hypothetical protein